MLYAFSVVVQGDQSKEKKKLEADELHWKPLWFPRQVLVTDAFNQPPEQKPALLRTKSMPDKEFFSRVITMKLDC